MPRPLSDFDMYNNDMFSSTSGKTIKFSYSKAASNSLRPFRYKSSRYKLKSIRSGSKTEVNLVGEKDLWNGLELQKYTWKKAISEQRVQNGLKSPKIFSSTYHERYLCNNKTTALKRTEILNGYTHISIALY